MKRQFISFLLLSATIQAFASFTPTLHRGEENYQLHWSLPTTLQPATNSWQKTTLLREDSEGTVPVSIMCQRQNSLLYMPEEATDVSQPERYWTMKRDLSLASVPYITLGIAFHAIKRDVRKVNNDINSGFHNRADDYIQFAPMLLTYGLKATGYQGRSQWGRLMASNAMSAAIMAGLVNGIKYTAKEKRPDGSTSNSFPSGHTATAFMAATILHKEYGLTRSLWYSVGGYAVATGIGAFRVMNNRHWVSDVMMGAGIGILSTELGYGLCDLIFKDKYTLRREMEDLNDLNEHPSFFSLQAGVGISIGSKGVPDDIIEAGGPSSIKHGISSVIGAEAAYFINPYLGFGVRARINSTAVTPKWNESEPVWNSGTLRYDPTTQMLDHPDTHEANYKYGSDTHKDQLSSFDVMGGVYGQLPLNKRMNLGAKLLFGRRQSGDVWWWADRSGNDEDNEKFLEEEITKFTGTEDISTYDLVKEIDLDGKGSFMFGTGIYFSYALKQNIVWRIGLDYDFTRARYDYEYNHYSLVDVANHYRFSDADFTALISTTQGSFRRNMHQLTPYFGICFSF